MPQGGVSETGTTKRMNVRARDPEVIIQMARRARGGANERGGWDDMERNECVKEVRTKGRRRCGDGA